MYDPSSGRWFTEDPIGFEGGDADLYGYVGNDPTSAVDPSGLQAEKYIETIRGTNVKIDKNTIRINGGTGTVNVLIDAIIKNRKGVQLEGWIEIRLTADVDIPAETHWLQFAQRTTLGREGRIVPGVFPILREKKKVWIKKGAEGRYVDCGAMPDSKGVPYYDTTSNSYRRLARELAIFDKPTFDPTSRELSEQKWAFDTFLVSEGKVYYHLRWKLVATMRDGKWTARYTDIIGEPVDKLPDWARGDRWHGGFLPDENDDLDAQILYRNPIPAANR